MTARSNSFFREESLSFYLYATLLDVGSGHSPASADLSRVSICNRQAGDSHATLGLEGHRELPGTALGRQ